MAKFVLWPLLDSTFLPTSLIEYNWFKYRISPAIFCILLWWWKTDWSLRIRKMNYIILFRVSQTEIFLTKTDWFNWFAHSGKRRVKWNFISDSFYFVTKLSYLIFYDRLHLKLWSWIHFYLWNLNSKLKTMDFSQHNLQEGYS